MQPNARNHISDSSIYKHAGCHRRTWLSQRREYHEDAALAQNAAVLDALGDFKAGLNKRYHETFHGKSVGSVMAKNQARFTKDLMAQGVEEYILDPQLKEDRNEQTKEGGLSAQPTALKRVERSSATGKIVFYFPVYCEPVVDFKQGNSIAIPAAINLKLAHACTILGRMTGYRPPMGEVMDRHGTISRIFPDFEAYGTAVTEIYRLSNETKAPEAKPCQSCMSCPWSLSCRKEMLQQKSLWALPGMTAQEKKNLEGMGVTDLTRFSDASAVNHLPKELFAERAKSLLTNEIVINFKGDEATRKVIERVIRERNAKKAHSAVALSLLFNDHLGGAYSGYSLRSEIRPPTGPARVSHVVDLIDEDAKTPLNSLKFELAQHTSANVLFVWSARDRDFLISHKLIDPQVPLIALQEDIFRNAIHLPVVHQNQETIFFGLAEGGVHEIEPALIRWTKTNDQDQRSELMDGLKSRSKQLLELSNASLTWIKSGACDRTLRSVPIAELHLDQRGRYHDVDKSTERRVTTALNIQSVTATPAAFLKRERVAGHVR